MEGFGKHPGFLAGKGWVKIGAQHVTSGVLGTLMVTLSKTSSLDAPAAGI